MIEDLGHQYPSVLLEAIAGRLEQTVGLTRLQHVIESSLTELDGLQTGFNQTVAALPPYARTLLSSEIGAVQAAAETYARAIRDLRPYLTEPDDSLLQSGWERLEQGQEELNLATLAFREAAMAERGPTGHPGLNAVVLAANSGDLESELERQFVQARSAQEATQAMTDAFLKPRLSEFLQRFLEFLDQAPDMSRAELEEQARRLGAAYDRFDVLGLVRRAAPGPTPLPSLNLLINGLRLVQDGHVEPALLGYFVDEARRVHQDTVRRHQEAGSTLEAALARRVEVGLEELGAALEAVAAVSGSPHPDPEGRLRQELTRRAHAFHSLWLAAAASAPPPTRVEAAEPAGEVYWTTRAQQLREAAAAVLSGQGSPEALLGLVEELERSRRQAQWQSSRWAQGLSRFSDEDQARARQCLELFGEGLQDLGQSLDHYRELARTRSDSLVAPAEDSLWGALDRLQHVQQLLAPYLNA